VRLFRSRQEVSDDIDRTLGGREFQARAAATGNARSPRVDRRVEIWKWVEYGWKYVY